jgi:hypothetical protein
VNRLAIMSPQGFMKYIRDTRLYTNDQQ